MRLPCRLALVPAVLSHFLPGQAIAADEPPAHDASAQQPTPAPRGLQIGARLAYSLPTGTVSGGTPSSAHLSDLETAFVPLALDAGYRFSRTAYLGGTIAWGPGISPNSQITCPSGVSCSRHNTQLRVDARLYLAPEARVSWWIAYGAGWEIAAYSQTYRGGTITSTLTGPVFADLQLGFDSRVDMGALGPYLGIALGEFVTEGVNPSAAPVSTWIPDPALHTWITLGLRGSYGPW